jgi:hypothetical protein
MPQYTTMTSRFAEPATNTVTLSAKAKALTQFVLDGTALPDFLAQHGNVILAFLGGAAVSSMLHNYFYSNRTHRGKIKLAVFHITRVIENTPEYHARLNRPHELVQAMQEEVKHLVNIHLNEDEAVSTMSELKHKLWTEVDEQRNVIKRRKSNEVARKDSLAEENLITQEAEAASIRSPFGAVPSKVATSSLLYGEDGNLRSSYEEQEQLDMVMVDVEQPSTVGSTPPLRQTTYRNTTSSPQQAPSSQQLPRAQKTPWPQLSHHSPESGETPLLQSVHSRFTQLGQTALSSPSLPARPPTRRARHDSSPSSTSKATPSSIGRSTYKYPSSFGSEGGLASPVLDSRSKVQSSPGYGLDYDDKDLYSSSSPSISVTSSPTGVQHSTKTRGKQPNMLQLVLKCAAGLEPDDTHHTSLPVPPKPKAAKPPSTVKLQKPPNSMALRTGNEAKGTWLHPIQEGLSSHESPAPDAPRMRVAESRPFWRDLQEIRKTRNFIRDIRKRADEIEQADQEQAEAAEEQEDAQWPDPTFTTSSSEEESAVDVNVAISPIYNIESPPSALEISPPLPSPPSPPKEPRKPKMSSPPASPLPDLPQSAINFSPSTEPDVVRVATPSNPRESSPAPMVSSPPTKKRGRGRPMQDQKPDTPLPPKRHSRAAKITKQQQKPATPVPLHRIRQICAEPQTRAQEEVSSGRSAKRSSAFKGSYRC